MFLLLTVVTFAQDSIHVCAHSSGVLPGENFSQKFLGEISPLDLAVLCIWAYLGVALNIMFEFLDRTKHNELKKDRPTEFKLSYWWSNNKIEFFLSMLLIPIGIIFSNEMFNAAPSNWGAILLGGGADRLIIIVSNFMKSRKSKPTEE